LDEITSLDIIINVSLSDEAIVKRLTGRRVCPDCGATYHTSRLEGKTDCGACGAGLTQRKDDEAETVLNRLKVYHEQTAPLEAYYKASGKMVEIDGSLTPEEGFAEIEKAIAAAALV